MPGLYQRKGNRSLNRKKWDRIKMLVELTPFLLNTSKLRRIVFLLRKKCEIGCVIAIKSSRKQQKEKTNKKLLKLWFQVSSFFSIFFSKYFFLQHNKNQKAVKPISKSIILVHLLRKIQRFRLNPREKSKLIILGSLLT